MNAIFQHLFGILGWSALSLIFGAAWFPLFAARLSPDLAWPLCRLSATILVTSFHLWPAFLGRVALTPWITLAIVAVIAIGTHSFTRITVKENLKRFFSKENLRHEGFILGVCFLFLLIVLFIPNVASSGERLRDTGYWVALNTQKKFPLLDPWLSGVSVPYYLLGYLADLEVFQFLPVSTLIQYNLGLIVAPALYAFALRMFFRLVWPGSRLAGAAAMCLLLACNFRSVEQAISHIFRNAPFQFWDSSRVIPGTINEFPLWTASLGDLHAHLMSLWILPTLLAVGIYFLFLKQKERGLPQGFSLAELSIFSFLTSWSYGMNTWEFPIIIAVSLISIVGSSRNQGKKQILKYLAFFGLATMVLCLPYALTSASGPTSFSFVNQRTSAWPMFQVFGLFFIPLMTLSAKRAYDSGKRELLAAMGLAVTLIFILDSGLAMVTTVSFFLGTTLLWRRESERILALMAYGGLLLVGFCEVAHLKDAFGGDLARMNTVFKFYVPAFTLLGVSALLAWKELLPLFSTTRLQWCAFGGLAFWLVASSSYLAFGLRSRTNGFRVPANFDGYGELRNYSPDDAVVINWMAEEVRRGELKGTLLEVIGGAYSWTGRAASFTGLETYAAWEGYSYWSHTGNDGLMRSRSKTAKMIFDGSYFNAAPSCGDFTEKLRQLKINYVFVGKEMKTNVAPYTRDKMDTCLLPLRRQGIAALYSVPATR